MNRIISAEEAFRIGGKRGTAIRELAILAGWPDEMVALIGSDMTEKQVLRMFADRQRVPEPAIPSIQAMFAARGLRVVR